MKNRKLKGFACALFCFACFTLNAQKGGIKGIVKDTAASKGLQYAIVALIDKKDSTLITSSRSFFDGSFVLDKIKPGNYTVMITYPTMADFIIDVSLKDTGLLDMGKIIMTSRFHLLQEVIVQSGKAIRMKGDTLEFKADSFPVAEGANIEELLRRLPGIEIGRDGKIKAQGENVTKVLVDGDEFFGDDPTLVTQYLQAKSVDKVQVFDKKSDQAVFSGIDDGVRNKTINIKLKENSKNGIFGKISAGTDANSFYSDEGMVNLFRSKEKFSVFGLGSNTGNIGIPFQGGSQSADFDMSDYESERLIGGDYDDMDFYESGLPTALNGGVQYANKWNADKRNINFNYRYNQLNTLGLQTNTQSQLLPDSSIRRSSSNDNSSSYTIQHKAGGYYNIVLDSFSSMKITVQGQKQNKTGANESYSESKDGAGNFLNKSTQSNHTNGNNSSFGSSLLWQRRFRKKGRTVSLSFVQSDRDNDADKFTEALSFYYNPGVTAPTGDSLNQLQQNKSHTASFETKITYTEPLANKLYLSAEYTWKQTNADRDRNVLERNTATGKYEMHIDSLSNNYSYSVITNMPGLMLQYNPQKFNFSAGGKLGYTTLEQTNQDSHISMNRKFVNLFPQVIASWNLSQLKHLSFNYSGQTQQPSIEQLQPLRENSNPLSITIGNPNLRPAFSHRISLNYFSFKMTGGATFSLGMGWSQTQNAITSSQTIDQFNKSTNQYINRDGLAGFNLYMNYSHRIGKMTGGSATNIGLNVSVNQYGFIRELNNTEIKTNQTSVSTGPSINFYKSKLLSFSYSANLSFSKSSSNVENIGTTYNWSHNHNGMLTIFLPWKLELLNNVSMNFQPANSSFNTSRQIIKWDASLTKKFLKNGQAVAKLAIFDILNQNTGYDRNASGGNVSESTSNYIPRYALLSFAWNFTHVL